MEKFETRVLLVVVSGIHPYSRGTNLISRILLRVFIRIPHIEIFLSPNWFQKKNSPAPVSRPRPCSGFTLIFPGFTPLVPVPVPVPILPHPVK